MQGHQVWLTKWDFSLEVYNFSTSQVQSSYTARIVRNSRRVCKVEKSVSGFV